MGLKYDSQKKVRKERSKYKIESWQDYEDFEKMILEEQLRYKEPTITGQVRITGGSAKNILIDIPKKTRPLTDRMKTQLFDLLRNEIVGMEILDLYAGSGSFGLEALSRGAKSVVFVDASKHAEKILLQNCTKTGFLTETTIIRNKTEDYVLKAQTSGELFDLIFMDPPYKKFNKKKSYELRDTIGKLVPLLPGSKNASGRRFKGVVMIKHPRVFDIQLVIPEKLRLYETISYGMNAISILIIDFESNSD